MVYIWLMVVNIWLVFGEQGVSKNGGTPNIDGVFRGKSHQNE